MVNVILAHSCIQVTFEFVIWAFDTFDNDLEIMNTFRFLDLNESCWLFTDEHFPFHKYFPKCAFG